MRAEETETRHPEPPRGLVRFALGLVVVTGGLLAQTKEEIRTTRTQYLDLQTSVKDWKKKIDKVKSSVKIDLEKVNPIALKLWEAFFKEHETALRLLDRDVATHLETIALIERGILPKARCPVGKGTAGKGNVWNTFAESEKELRGAGDLSIQCAYVAIQLLDYQTDKLVEFGEFLAKVTANDSEIPRVWKTALESLAKEIGKEVAARATRVTKWQRIFEEGGSAADFAVIHQELSRIQGSTLPKELPDTLQVDRARRFETDDRLVAPKRGPTNDPIVILFGSAPTGDHITDLLEAFLGFRVDDGREPALAKWKAARLGHVVAAWKTAGAESLRRVRRSYAESLDRFRKKPSYAQIDLDETYLRAAAIQEEYEARKASVVQARQKWLKDHESNLAGELNDAVDDLEDMFVPLDPLPVVREFPKGWKDTWRAAWPAGWGTLEQMELVEDYSYKGKPEALEKLREEVTKKNVTLPGFWRLRGRGNIDMVLIVPRAGPPFFVDRHEVTVDEFEYALEKARRKSLFLARSWWKNTRTALRREGSTQGLLLTGVSFDAAQDFARDAYREHGLELALPSPQQWKLVFDTFSQPKAAEKLKALDAAFRRPAISTSPSEPTPAEPTPARPVLNLTDGVSEWCLPEKPGDQPVVCGLSSYKPWSDVAGGRLAWLHDNATKNGYYENPKRQRTHPPERVAPAFGFRCIFELKKVR